MIKYMISERMAGHLKEEVKTENIDIKEEIPEENPPSSFIEETCTVYIKEDDVKVEISETKGKAKTRTLKV